MATSRSEQGIHRAIGAIAALCRARREHVPLLVHVPGTQGFLSVQ